MWVTTGERFSGQEESKRTYLQLLERGLVESPEESMWVTTGERFSGQEESKRTYLQLLERGLVESSEESMG